MYVCMYVNTHVLCIVYVHMHVSMHCMYVCICIYVHCITQDRCKYACMYCRYILFICMYVCKCVTVLIWYRVIRIPKVLLRDKSPKAVKIKSKKTKHILYTILITIPVLTSTSTTLPPIPARPDIYDSQNCSDGKIYSAKAILPHVNKGSRTVSASPPMALHSSCNSRDDRVMYAAIVLIPLCH